MRFWFEFEIQKHLPRPPLSIHRRPVHPLKLHHFSRPLGPLHTTGRHSVHPNHGKTTVTGNIPVIWDFFWLWMLCLKDLGLFPRPLYLYVRRVVSNHCCAKPVLLPLCWWSVVDTALAGRRGWCQGKLEPCHNPSQTWMDGFPFLKCLMFTSTCCV